MMKVDSAVRDRLAAVAQSVAARVVVAESPMAMICPATGSRARAQPGSTRSRSDCAGMADRPTSGACSTWLSRAAE